MVFKCFFVAYLTALICAFLAGVKRFKILDTPSKVLCGILGISIVAELIAWYAAVKYHNNLPIYNLFSLLWFFLISIYFNSSIIIFKRYNIGIFAGAVGVLLGTLNIIFLQPLNTLNSYFLFWQGINVITFSLFQLAEIYKEDVLTLRKVPHFWFAIILCFFWSATFIFWGLYPALIRDVTLPVWLFHTLLSSVNIITYLAFTIVFLLYPKMLLNGK